MNSHEVASVVKHDPPAFPPMFIREKPKNEFDDSFRLIQQNEENTGHIRPNSYEEISHAKEVIQIHQNFGVMPWETIQTMEIHQRRKIKGSRI